MVADASEKAGLYNVLKTGRSELIDCWSRRVQRFGEGARLSRAEILDHIPSFVDELIAALYPDALPLPALTENAAEHGAQRFRLGFDIGEVVREYGVLNECIQDLVRDAQVTVSLREQEVTGRWLNAGIANALAQYVSQRDSELQRQASEHLGFIAHEVRNPLSAAWNAFQRLRATELAAGGRAVEILERNLRRTADVIDSALTHASLKMGVSPRPQAIALDDFIREIVADAAFEAEGKGIDVVVDADSDVRIDADARLLGSAISNLLQNAVKFSRPSSRVVVRAKQADGRITIDVADSCGGLPPGKAEELFAPLVQRDENRSGFGLGLAIARQAAEAHNGTVKARDIPGTGCVFTIDLPAISAARAVAELTAPDRSTNVGKT
jgi:signal transduction histidine kinase